ncbi:MAG: NAD-dependent epimerase/dehydratase family protein, partial [Candidatus Marinimicrobia bacterium]|nr:NAD-dependent epimerase/dehydratase family protein [Candidatus Neomarinimicrobiota bacterium]
MIIVTGGAGLIGSAVVWKLNGRGVDDILIVDHNPDGDKDDNLAALKYSQYIDKSDFLQKLFDGRLSDNIESIIHLGACTDTTETDKEYLY